MVIILLLALAIGGCASGPDKAALKEIDEHTQAARTGRAGLSPEELRLYELLNLYRAEHGLAPIPISPSLTEVAHIHVRDMYNHPAKGKCNGHSWSDSGKWSPCCYTDDHAEAQCMWDKPRELTSYPGYGFEIAMPGSGGYVVTAESALRGWQNSRPHNAVMTNKGIWENNEWKAVGIGIYRSQAAIWFGMEADPEGK